MLKMLGTLYRIIFKRTLRMHLTIILKSTFLTLENFYFLNIKNIRNIYQNHYQTHS